MSVLEKTILDLYSQLDPDAKQRVRSAIDSSEGAQHEASPMSNFDFEAWEKEVEQIREGIKADNNGVWPFAPGEALEILRQIRDGEDENW